MKFTFGIVVRDKITGFVGVITGYASYITGCAQYLVRRVDEKGTFVEARWIDEDRLAAVEGAKAIEVMEQKRPGFDRAAPVR